MPLNAEETIQLLLKTNKEQEKTIADLRAAIKEQRTTVANLNETLEELRRKRFGTSSERTAKANNLNLYQYLYTLLLYMPDKRWSSIGKYGKLLNKRNFWRI